MRQKISSKIAVKIVYEVFKSILRIQYLMAYVQILIIYKHTGESTFVSLMLKT